MDCRANLGGPREGRGEGNYLIAAFGRAAGDALRLEDKCGHVRNWLCHNEPVPLAFYEVTLLCQACAKDTSTEVHQHNLLP